MVKIVQVINHRKTIIHPHSMSKFYTRNAKPLRAAQVISRPRKATQRNSRSSGLVIPQLRTNVVKTHRFRFIASSALVNVPLTPTSLLGACGGVCTVANSVLTPFNRTVKIARLEMWAPTSSSTTGATCAVNWIGSGSSPNLEVSDTTINVSRPAHVLAYPPADSLSAFWSQPAATQLCTLSGPGGTVVDITLRYIETDQTTAVSDQAITTGTLKVQYYLALDGPGTNLLVPVSLNTTS